MNKWLVVLISAIAGLFLFGGIGVFAMVSTTQGDVLMTGDASEDLTFEGEWDKFYDIYAEDKDLVITFETSETHDSNFTYLQRCGVDDNSIIGMSGDCGDLRENHYLVADFTVEASGVGDVTLTFDGTGEVMIVQSGMGGVLGSTVLLCLGCCLSPVLIIVSGVKLAKGKGQNVILVNGGQFVHQQPVFQQPVSQQPPQAYNFSTAPVQQSYQDSSQTSEKDFSSWDSSPTVSDKPPGYQKPTHSSGGYEWLEHNGKMYHRDQGSFGDWNEFNG